jgi:hypothetical protein
MVLRVSAESSEEVAALISAMKRIEPETAKAIRASAKADIDVIVSESLHGHSGSRLAVRGIAETTRVKLTNQNITVQAGAVKGSFSNGLDARKSIQSFEFGSKGGRVATYDRKSRKGGTHKVTRHTMSQFGPPIRGGRTFYPAVKDMAPRAVSLLIQTALRTIHDLIESR